MNTALPTTFKVNVAGINTLMPVGIYLTKIIKYAIKQGPNGPYMALTLSVLSDADGDTEFADRKLFSNVSFAPTAAFFLSEFLLALGYSEDDLEAGEFEFDPQDVEDQDVYVSVGIGKNPKNNKDQNEVNSFVVPVDGFVDDDEDEEEAEEAFSASEPVIMEEFPGFGEINGEVEEVEEVEEEEEESETGSE